MHKSALGIALLLLPLLVVLEGCHGCEDPRAALSTAPDRACQWGVEAGLDVAIWECIDQKHVVAYTRSGTIWCSALTVERVACGELTPIEKTFDDGDACGEDSHPFYY